ncbi:TPA: hypothetical protein RUZ06_003378, partial [Vibrio cholerae]|uniref:hypothetical protein n=1 Tax=Vibrio cholerae TaxID=666 RepID=UPI0028D9BBD4|nr:hypothetical protein [Vibrio cholerae]
MIYFRMLCSMLIAFGGWFLSKRQLDAAFSNADIIKVDGLLNMWASYGIFLLCCYLFIYYLSGIFKISFPVGEINKVIIVIAIVIAPLLAIGTSIKTKSNVAHYVECRDERTITSRFSSRTYALSSDLCSKLDHRKGT